ncbi:MAG: tol-pal system protein YbgF [Nitrospira sp.]|nr:tol-pal system protein YbgF [Nitrospira sp.]
MTESVTCEYKYVLGDNDTKQDARKIAFVEAKRRCAEQIGTLLASETIVSSSDLTKDEIRAYSLAVMKTDVVSESFRSSGDSLAVLVKLKARYDSDLMGDRFKELLSDRGRIQDLKQAQEQIVALELQMASLQRQLLGVVPNAKEDRGRNAQQAEPQGEAKRRDAKVQQQKNQATNRAGAETPQAATETALKVSGLSASNEYLALVRLRISNAWSAPPLDGAEAAYVVIVQFRLHRDGTVTGVSVEQSSGSEYHDLAGKRAVLSANPLPAFPPDITTSYLDVKYAFRSARSAERVQPIDPVTALPGIPAVRSNTGFNSAYNDYLSGKYELAVAGFQMFIKDFRDAPLRPVAYYWLGESYYNLRDYGRAIQAFQQLVAEYPESEKQPPALYKLGLAFAETGEIYKSRVSFSRLLHDFPSSDEAPLAEMKLREIR